MNWRNRTVRPGTLSYRAALADEFLNSEIEGVDQDALAELIGRPTIAQATEACKHDDEMEYYEKEEYINSFKHDGKEGYRSMLLHAVYLLQSLSHEMSSDDGLKFMVTRNLNQLKELTIASYAFQQYSFNETDIEVSQDMKQLDEEIEKEIKKELAGGLLDKVGSESMLKISIEQQAQRISKNLPELMEQTACVANSHAIIEEAKECFESLLAAEVFNKEAARKAVLLRDVLALVAETAEELELQKHFTGEIQRSA